MPCGRKRKRHKISTHKRKKRLRKNRHKKKDIQNQRGLLAQLDRAPVSGTGGPRFESWIAHHMFLVYKSMDLTGCGAVRLARFLGVEEVAGSNPVIPTMGLFTTVGVMPKQITSGCSAARLARSLRERKVVGSNPATPTIFSQKDKKVSQNRVFISIAISKYGQ